MSGDPSIYLDRAGAGLSPYASASLHLSIVGRVLDEGGHNKSFVSPVSFVGTVEGVPDVDTVEKGMVRVVVNESWRRDGLVFFIRYVQVFIVDLGVLLRLDPILFYFTFFLFTYASCDRHVITSVTIVQVTYCPCEFSLFS